MSINNIDISKSIEEAKKLLDADENISPQMRSMVNLLILVISLLVNKLKLNSRNSSKPPSEDKNRPRGSRSKAKGEKKKPGGQPGHKGSHLKRVETPDVINVVDIDRATLPAGNYCPAGYESRQVIDIQIKRLVTEYRAEILVDDNGNHFMAQLPANITQAVQYSENIKAIAVYMSQQQLIPYARVKDFFQDQFGIPVSTGSLVNFNREAFDLLAYFEKIAKEQLTASRIINADETGINVNGSLLWLHNASNSLWTLFYPHAKRGEEAMTEIGILPNFKGILCHDHWKSYFHFTCQHALCNAHHLRELEFAHEVDGQVWAKQMQDLLCEINEVVNKAGGCLDHDQAEAWKAKFRQILADANSECPAPTSDDQPRKRGRVKKSKSRNLLERLTNFETETLRFMTDKDVPFTNNQGERDIRMTKVQQKISGCFRSMDGANAFCRIRSYLSTCDKHGVAPTKALELLFSGKLPDFLKTNKSGVGWTIKAKGRKN